MLPIDPGELRPSKSPHRLRPCLAKIRPHQEAISFVNPCAGGACRSVAVMAAQRRYSMPPTAAARGQSPGSGTSGAARISSRVAVS